jgi:hypothetical protein
MSCNPCVWIIRRFNNATITIPIGFLSGFRIVDVKYNDYDIVIKLLSSASAHSSAHSKDLMSSKDLK